MIELLKDEAERAIRASWPARRTLPHCSGACDQGRKPCASPASCHQPEDDYEGSEAVVVPVLMLVAVVAVVAFVVIVLSIWRPQ